MKWRVVKRWHRNGSERWVYLEGGYSHRLPLCVTESHPALILWEADRPGHWAVVTSDKTTLYFDDKDTAMAAVTHLKENWL